MEARLYALDADGLPLQMRCATKTECDEIAGRFRAAGGTAFCTVKGGDTSEAAIQVRRLSRVDLPDRPEGAPPPLVR